MFPGLVDVDGEPGVGDLEVGLEGEVDGLSRRSDLDHYQLYNSLNYPIKSKYYTIIIKLKYSHGLYS